MGLFDGVAVQDHPAFETWQEVSVAGDKLNNDPIVKANSGSTKRVATESTMGCMLVCSKA